jgi:N-acetylneuraminate synthase
MNQPFIIAEVGINANGSRALAMDLIRMAHDAGADAVKFQKRTIEIVYSPEELAKPRESPWGDTQGDQKRGLELSWADYDVLWKLAGSLGIEMFWSAWDLPSLQTIMLRYKPRYNKIASTMLTHGLFVEACAALEQVHTFISTGMTEYEDIDRAVELFQQRGRSFTLLHCIGMYPCPDIECNIRMIETFKKRYPGIPIGYSGHETGLLPSLVAVTLGAVAVERHISLNRASYGSDQAASLEMPGLRKLAEYTRLIEPVLGTGVKEVLDKEKEAARKMRYWQNG